MDSYLLKTAEFLLYTALIYLCYITSGVYHQKILKHQYVSNIDNLSSQFDAPIIFTFFSQVVCAIIGFFILEFNKHVNKVQPINIPFKKVTICALIINLNMWTYNQAVKEASFPAVVMVKSCSLLSVILVGIFCSRVKDKTLKLGKSKIVIGIIVTLGIIFFNYFKVFQGGNDKPITLISSILLIVSLMGDGILPDLQAEIKSEHKPGVIDMYYQINRITALIALLYSLVTFQLDYITRFIIQHDEIRWDIGYYSVLNALGQLIIYKMIKLFKQHIPAFVIATRKCFTVVVNIVHFGHQINLYQGFGMVLVFFAVLMEVYENYKEKVKLQAEKEELKQASAPEIQNEQLSALKMSEEIPTKQVQLPNIQK